MLTMLDGLKDIAAGGFNAADKLNNDINIRIIKEIIGSQVTVTSSNSGGNCFGERTKTVFRRMWAPVRRVMRSLCSRSTCAVPLPTVPKPIMPICIVFIGRKSACYVYGKSK